MVLRLTQLGTLRPPFLVVLAATVLLGGVTAFKDRGFLVLSSPQDSLVASVLPGAVIALTNEERDDSGLGSLKANALLNQAAQMKADDMAAKSYYAHESPDGTIPPYWLNKVGYKFQAMGENLVIDRENSESVVSAWMGSQYHRENILNPSFTEIGIGVANGTYKGRDTIYVVQMLARPQVVTAAPKVTEKPKPAPKPVQVRPTPVTPVPTRSAATTSILVRPLAPKLVVRDKITPVLETIASTRLVEVPTLVASTTYPPPIVPPYTSEPVELAVLVPIVPEQLAIRTKFRSFVNGVGAQVRNFFSPIF